jgi:hypothetical protein
MLAALTTVIGLESPAAAMQQWRTMRLEGFRRVYDPSRYHVQVLFVDDDGYRARTCEAMLERVAEWADAGWWIYPHAASIGIVSDGDSAPASLRETAARYDLSRARIEAPAARLDPSDLNGAYDLIVCVDLAVLEQVRAMLRVGSDEPPPSSASEVPAAEADDAAVLSLCDFLACGGERMEALDDELRALVAPQYQAILNGGIELPSVGPRSDKWEALLALTTLCCAGMTTFLKESIDQYFEDAYTGLLATHYPAASDADVPWPVAEEALRRHIVTGGLDMGVRRRLFEEHIAALKQQEPDAEQG